MRPVRELLSRKQAVIDLFHTSASIFPHIVATGALLCTEEETARLAKAARGYDLLSTKEKWRTGSTVLQTIIAKHNSLLLTDLFIDMENYCQIPVFEGFQNPFDDMSLHKGRSPEYLYNLISQKNYRAIYLAVEEMLLQTTLRVEAYLDAVEKKYPGFAGQPQVPFDWDAKKGRVHSYLEIARDLVCKIGTGVYENGELLPSIGAMCKEYGASPTTVMHALSLLNTIKVARTINGKGTLVTLEAAKTAKYRLTDSSVQKDVYTVLSALQLVVLTIRKMAVLGMEYLAPNRLAGLAEALEETPVGELSLPDVFLEALVEAQPYAAFRLVYMHLREFLSWGFYGSVSRFDPARMALLQTQCQKALSYLQNGEQDAFADILQEIYLSAFRHIKERMLDCGVGEVAKLAEPQQEYL